MTISDDAGIHATKAYLQQHLNIRDLGSPRYFLGIELGCKLETSPIEACSKFWDTLSLLLEDANLYHILLGKLITVTCPDIVYAVSVLSQLM